MAWVYLLLAGVFEIGFTTALKLSEGFTKFWWSAAFLVLMTLSLGTLTVAARTIPLGTAYAVWTGIGAAGTAIVGIVWFKDPLTVGRGVFLVLLIGSVIGLKLVSAEPAAPLDPAPAADAVRE